MSDILPSGKEILAKIEAAGQELPAEDQKAILEISDDEAMAKFLASNIGENVNPDQMQAASIFSGWLMNKLNLPPLLLTMQFDNLGSCGKAVEMCFRELNDSELKPEQKNALLRTLVEACRQKGLLLKHVLSMAQIAKPPSEKTKPKNAPPDSSKATQVLVQVNNRVQAEASETESRIINTP